MAMACPARSERVALPGCLADIAVEAAERHTVQYFEMFASRATYSGDWWACTRLDKAPWDF